MTDITGTVQRYNIKNGTGKNNKPYSLYSVQVDGEYYSNAFEPLSPAPEPGDVVKIRFDEVQNGKYTNRNITEFRIETKAADNPDKGNVNSTSGGPVDRDAGAAWGNAGNIAAQLVTKAADVDALPLSAGANKGGKAKRFEELLEIFDKTRVRIYQDSMDIDRVLAKHADEGEVEDNTPPALPDQDELDEIEDDIPF
jgi:hypothetical protein